MVRLVLTSSKGNGVRYFPHSGYLGLTPIKVEGAVITRLDHDCKPLPARSISVSIRCYELVLGPTGVLKSNVLESYNKTLWEKPDNQDYADVGNMELPFRLTVPVSAKGHSTASYVEYRCLWRVEAVLNHMYISAVGSRQIKHADLPLVRYDLPSLPPHFHRRMPSNGIPLLDRQTYKPRAPRIRYSIVSPSSFIGPLDLVPISVYLLPNDASVSIRSASAIVERRIQVKDSSGSHHNAPATSNQFSFIPPASSLSHAVSSYQDANPNHSASSLSSSNPTITPDTHSQSTASLATEHRPLITSNPQRPSTSTYVPPDLDGARTSIHPVAASESSGGFDRDQHGIFSKTLAVSWPLPKSNGRWAIGETVHTKLVSVKFFIRVKIIVTSPGGTESLDLEEQEIYVVSTNDEERQVAMSNYNESQRARSKSKSPRRSRRPGEDETVSPSTVRPSSSRPSSPRASHGKSKASRRPHTSAGPRDKTAKFTFSPNGETTPPPPPPPPPISQEPPKRGKYTRPETSDSFSGAGPIRTNRESLYAPRLGSTPSSGSMSSASTGSNATSVSSSSETSRGSADVREWEQELARIEMQSRRSSDMLGFGMKRHTRRILITGES